MRAVIRRSFWLLFVLACAHPPDIYDIAGLEIGAKSFNSPLLYSYSTCESLMQDLKRSALEEMHTRFAMHLKNPPSRFKTSGDTTMAPMPAGGMANEAKSPLVEGVDFSGTNNQEKNIDEADIIKLDGNYFYILNRSSLEIIAISDAGSLQKASKLNLESPGSALLINDDKAIVIANNSLEEQSIRVDTINLSFDRKNPSVNQSLNFVGEYLSGRRIGNKIYLATYFHHKIPGLINYPVVPDDYYEQEPDVQNAIWAQAIKDTVSKNEDIISKFDFLKLLPTPINALEGSKKPEPVTMQDCANTFGADKASAMGFLSLITLTPDSKGHYQVDMQRVRGNRPIVYASKNQFILASPEHEPWWFFNNENLKDQTTIHRFDLSSGPLPAYKDSVRVPGSLHNSFSLSEYKNYVRVATTTSSQSRSWQEQSVPDENHLFVLGDTEDGFDIVSSINALAPGEKIWSARFSNDLGFLVTFERVDPLFTLDLSDPLKPKVVGELKVPGVSTYLQDIGDNNLLAIGYGGNEEGLDFKTNISLFDVSDLRKPKLAYTLSLAPADNANNSWSSVSSEANTSHLAINYFSPVAMTAIPISAQRFVENPLDPMGGEYQYVSKLSLVKTQAGQDLIFYGEVDHSEYYNKNQNQEIKAPAIRRSYFVGEYIYAISPKAISAHRLADMEKTGSYQL